MRKLLLIMTTLILSITIMGCDFLSGTEQTTTEMTAVTTVDTTNYIEINSVKELQAMEMNKSYKLVSDIDVADIDWAPIGSYDNPFKGNFDGNNHTISNLTIINKVQIYNGLFGYLEGNVTNLTLSSVDIDFQTDNTTFIGGLAGCTNGDITNVQVNGQINLHNSNSNSYVGLLIGFSQAKLDSETKTEDFVPNIIDNNSVSGKINAVSISVGYIGGLIGKTYNSTVSNNLSVVNMDIVIGSYPVYIGGLIGHNYGGILIGLSSDLADTNIYIENNIIKSNIKVEDTKANFSVGGAIGYNNKGYNRNNYVESQIEILGKALSTNEIKVGGYVGENWHSILNNIVINSSYTNIISGDLTFMFGAVQGGNYSDLAYFNIYLSENTSFDKPTDVTIVTVADLTDINFYKYSLNWNLEFYNKIIN